MAYAPRLLLSVLVVTAACGEDDPGLGAGNTSNADGSSGTGVVDSTGDETIGTGSATTGEDSWTEICDGSEDIRLAYTLVGGGTVDNEIVREIGWQYLYVLGTCEYFVLPSSLSEHGPWPDVRTGVLDVEAEEALSRALDYGNLAEAAGNWGTAGTFDAATLLVSDGVSIVACNGECLDGPTQAQALWQQLPRIEELWVQSEGSAYQGPVRISVVGWEDSIIDEVGPNWPLAPDPWSLAIDGDSLEDAPGAGTSVLIDDEGLAQQLRELRRQYREDDLPDDVPNALDAYGHLSFTSVSGQDLFQLWIRDSLPIEDDRGLIPLP